jgi:hypothetical protein
VLFIHVDEDECCLLLGEALRSSEAEAGCPPVMITTLLVKRAMVRSSLCSSRPNVLTDTGRGMDRVDAAYESGEL